MKTEGLVPNDGPLRVRPEAGAKVMLTAWTSAVIKPDWKKPEGSEDVIVALPVALPVIVAVPELNPSRIRIDAGGSAAAVFEEAKLTVVPPTGAGSVSWTVNGRDRPGETKIEPGRTIAACWTVTPVVVPVAKPGEVPLSVTPPAANPEIVTWVEALPSGIVTLAGAETIPGRLCTSVTGIPPAPATTVLATVTSALRPTPSRTVEGERLILGAAATLTVTVAEVNPPAVAVIVVDPPFRMTPSTETVPCVWASGMRIDVVEEPLTVATRGWKGVSVTLAPPGGAGIESVTVSVALPSACTFRGEGARERNGWTTWKETEFEVCASVGFAASGLTTRTGKVPRAARSAAVSPAVRRVASTKLVVRSASLNWTTDSGGKPAPRTGTGSPELPRIPTLGLREPTLGTGTVTVKTTAPECPVPAGETTSKVRAPVGAAASIVIRTGRFTAVPPGWIAATTPVPVKLTAVAP